MDKKIKQFKVTYCCKDLESLVKNDVIFFYSTKTLIEFHVSETDQPFVFCPFCGQSLG